MQYKISYNPPKNYTIGGFGVMFNSIIYNLIEIDLMNNFQYDEHYIDWSNKNILYLDENIGNNVWDYYFENCDKYNCINYTHIPSNTIDYQININDDDIDLNKIPYLFMIYNKYIRVNKDILNIVDSYVKNEFIGNVLGVQYRYTDKISEIYQISPDILINMMMNELETYDVIYIATDYQPVIDILKMKSLKFKFSNVSRSYNCIGSHFQHNDRNFDPYFKGYEVLLDILILSKCDSFLYSKSNISLSALILNNLKYKKIKCINNENRLCDS